jgi:fructose-1,6-bisphosphatase
MNRADIIRMANEAKLPRRFEDFEPSLLTQLEKFAQLVANDQLNICSEICERYGDKYDSPEAYELAELMLRKVKE